VALRAGGTVAYLHGDHLGSATLTTDGGGNWVGEARYTPYGEMRRDYPRGVIPTDRLYTGQRAEAFGLYDYRARYYSPGLGRFVSADTLVPSPGKPQTLNRYAYVLNNPLRHTDPSGHCIPGWNCPGDVPPPRGVRFTGHWVTPDKEAALDAVWTVAEAMSQVWRRELIRQNRELVKTGDLEHVVPIPSASELFAQVFGRVDFHRVSARCETGCWAETWVPRITIYANAPEGGYTFQNAAYELGHFFAQRASRQPYHDLNAARITYVDPDTNQVVPVAGGGWGTGYVRTNRGYVLTNGRTWPWQQNTSATANEDFADMFLGWAYNHFADDPAGAARYQWMAVNMPRWIALAVAGGP
jgi:RHS repeat-associated protein